MPRHDDTEEKVQPGHRDPLSGVWVRTIGRRATDFMHQKGWWALVIGVLMQGGFLWMSKSLLDVSEKQAARLFEVQQKQHEEMVQVIRDQTAVLRTMSDRSETTRVALDRVSSAIDRLEEASSKRGRGRP